jgi:transcription initiation factor TFIID subunit 11
MASSPPYSQGSPPYTSVALPTSKKRPSISPLTTSVSKRRKPSSARPSHLRQTSFPPEDGTSVSATYSRSPSVDSSIVQTPSVVSAGGFAGTKKGKRKSKVTVADDAASIVSGDGRRGTTAGAGPSSRVSLAGSKTGSMLNDAGLDAADVSDEEPEELGALPSVEVEKSTLEDEQAERQRLAILIEAMTPEQKELYQLYRRVKLKKEHVRRLANHTLSQSVPSSIVLTLMGVTKLFMGEIVERARDVQYECMAKSEVDPTRQRWPEGTKPREKKREMDRGPITPDHLREALRRYKKDREGGSAGFLGLSGQGMEKAAARVNGKKLFR